MHERPVESGFDPNIPAFLQRGHEQQEAGPELQPDESFEDSEPPYRAAQEDAREAERELERQASGGHTADEALGSDGKPLIVGNVATVVFGAGKHAYPKTGTLLALDGPSARVRLNGSKEPLGEAFPHSRVSTGPINGGKPLKTKGEKKTAAEHALHLKEYQDAIAEGRKPRPSDGFAHAQPAAEDTAPLPRRLLKGHNRGVSEGTVFRHLGSIRSKEAAVAAATAKLREAWKAAKDDGVDAKVLKQVMSELKLSPDELVEQINTRNSYRGMVHLPNHGPLDLPGGNDQDDPTKREGYARESGLQAGFRGADASTNPYPDSSDACHIAWAHGHQEAQNRLALRSISEL